MQIDGSGRGGPFHGKLILIINFIWENSIFPAPWLWNNMDCSENICVISSWLNRICRPELNEMEKEWQHFLILFVSQLG